MNTNSDRITELIKFCDEKFKLFKSLFLLEEQNHWKFVEERDNIVIHSKLDEETGLHYIRAEGEVKAPAKKVYELLDDETRVLEWDRTIESANLVEKIGFLKFSYLVAKKPAPLVDRRDMILLSNKYEDTDGKIFLIGATYPHPKYPIQQSPVRCKIPIGGWAIIPNQKDPNISTIVYTGLVDPSGWVPKPVVNAFSIHQAMNVREVRNLLEGTKNNHHNTYSSHLHL